jgi:hypothetical protein
MVAEKTRQRVEASMVIEDAHEIPQASIRSIPQYPEPCPGTEKTRAALNDEGNPKLQGSMTIAAYSPPGD